MSYLAISAAYFTFPLTLLLFVVVPFDCPFFSCLLCQVREDSLEQLLAASDAAIAMSQQTLHGFSVGDAGAEEVRRLWGGGSASRGGSGSDGGTSNLDNLLRDAGILRRRAISDTPDDDFSLADAAGDEEELSLLEQQLLQLSYERHHSGGTGGNDGLMNTQSLVRRFDGWQRRRQRPVIGAEAWAAAAEAADQRGGLDGQCAICMGDLAAATTGGGPPLARSSSSSSSSPPPPPLSSAWSPPTTKRQQVPGGGCSTLRECTLLSCSHIFHTSCIRAFERFNCDNGTSSAGDTMSHMHVCPVCRTHYARRAILHSPSRSGLKISDVDEEEEEEETQNREEGASTRLMAIH